MIAAVALVAVMAGAGPITVDPLELGAPEVSAQASPSEVRLGQQITLIVTATYGTGVEVNLPDPLFPAGAPIEIASRDSKDRVRTDGRRVREWQLHAYVWELGEFDIPPIQVTFTAGGRAATVPTNAIPLRVVGVLGDADDPKLMRQMAAPVPLWRRSWFLAWLAGGVLASLVLVIALWRARRRRTKPRRAKAPVVRIAEAPLTAGAAQESASEVEDGDPHRETAPPPPVVAPPVPVTVVRARRKLDGFAEAALARLRALEQSGRLDSDRRGAYREMAAIIRDYLGARYDVDAQELTTRELCQAIGFRSATAAGLTRAWLEQCDVIKYAGLSATGDEARAVLDGACWLIDRTTPGAPSSDEEAARA